MEQLLFTSGGALELSKCSYYVMHWEWINGLPQLTPKNEVAEIKKITLTSGTSPQQIEILQCDPSEAHKTLGVYVAPNGNEHTQEEYLNTKSHQIASLVSSLQLTKSEAWMVYQICWIPAVTYSLSTTTMSAKSLLTIRNLPTKAFLQKMGLNKYYPTGAESPHRTAPPSVFSTRNPYNRFIDGISGKPHPGRRRMVLQPTRRNRCKLWHNGYPCQHPTITAE